MDNVKVKDFINALVTNCGAKITLIIQIDYSISSKDASISSAMKILILIYTNIQAVGRFYTALGTMPNCFLKLRAKLAGDEAPTL